MKLYSLEQILKTGANVGEDDFKNLLNTILYASMLTELVETGKFEKGTYESDYALINLKEFINQLEI